MFQPKHIITYRFSVCYKEREDSMTFKTCSKCGENLDVGEKCDCENIRKITYTAEGKDNMKLISLMLKNFKGVKSFTFEPQGSSATIYGDNATGKTTVMDAMLWLLFGKNSENAADFGIKTRINGEEMSHGEHEVCGVFELADARVITLRKVYHEVWSTPRGKATAVFNGNTVDCFIGEGNNPVGVPTKAGEYKKYIESLANEDIFKLLTNPMFFNVGLSWQKRREIILEVCGDVSDKDVVDGQPALKRLADLIGNQTVEQIKKETAFKAKRIKEELQKIPPRIDELQLAEVSEKVVTEAKSFTSGGNIEVQKEIDATSQKLAEAMTDDPKNAVRSDLSTVELQLRQMTANATAAQEKEKARLREFMAAETDIVNGLMRELTDLAGQKTQLEMKITACADKRTALLNQFQDIAAETFAVPEITTTCPTCRQHIPEDEIVAAQAKIAEDAEAFNLRQAKKKRAIQDEGAANNEKKVIYEKELEEVLAAINDKDFDLTEARKRENLFATQIKAVPLSYPAEQEKLLTKKKELLTKLEAADDVAREELIASLEQKRKDLQARMDEGRKKVAMVEAGERNKTRIQELLENEKLLNKEYEKLEEIIFLCESFVRAKVDMLTAKINSKFSIARFRLFNENIGNDGIVECCETMVDGVPFTDLNNAMRINIGLDIIRTLSQHYNFAAPIFIDNAESVTSFIEMPGQQLISLIVSEPDKALRVVS